MGDLRSEPFRTSVSWHRLHATRATVLVRTFIQAIAGLASVEGPVQASLFAGSLSILPLLEHVLRPVD
jgi:hypothetical protein